MYGRHQQCAWIVFAKHKMLFTQKIPLKRNALHVSVSSAARVAVFHIISWALWFELFRFGKRRQSTILSIGKYFISRLVFVDHCSTAITEKVPPSNVYSYKWNCVEPYSTMLVFLHDQDTHQIIYQMACWYSRAALLWLPDILAVQLKLMMLMAKPYNCCDTVRARKKESPFTAKAVWLGEYFPLLIDFRIKFHRFSCDDILVPQRLQTD